MVPVPQGNGGIRVHSVAICVQTSHLDMDGKSDQKVLLEITHSMLTSRNLIIHDQEHCSQKRES